MLLRRKYKDFIFCNRWFLGTEQLFFFRTQTYQKVGKKQSAVSLGTRYYPKLKSILNNL